MPFVKKLLILKAMATKERFQPLKTFFVVNCNFNFENFLHFISHFNLCNDLSYGNQYSTF